MSLDQSIFDDYEEDEAYPRYYDNRVCDWMSVLVV